MPPAIPLSEETIRQRLREASLRVTVARIKILQIIAKTPMNADTLSRHSFMQGEPFSVSTVYRILQELEEKGFLIKEVDAERKFTYRLKPAEAMATSCQLTCLESGRTVVFDDAVLRQRLGELLRLHGLADQKGQFTLQTSIDAVLGQPKGAPARKKSKK